MLCSPFEPANGTHRLRFGRYPYRAVLRTVSSPSTAMPRLANQPCTNHHYQFIIGLRQFAPGWSCGPVCSPPLARNLSPSEPDCAVDVSPSTEAPSRADAGLLRWTVCTARVCRLNPFTPVARRYPVTRSGQFQTRTGCPIFQFVFRSIFTFPLPPQPLPHCVANYKDHSAYDPGSGAVFISLHGEPAPVAQT